MAKKQNSYGESTGLNMKEAIKELKAIAKMTDQKSFDRTKLREQALEEWLHKWVIELEYSQLIMNPRAMTTEAADLLKEHVTGQLIDQALEDAVSFEKEPNKLTGTMICLRRKKP